jgi:sulfatase modifying factor 1
MRCAVAFCVLALCPMARAEEITNSLGMKLVRIEAGEFMMGTGAAPPSTRAEWSEREWDEAPAHAVKISRPFFLEATEVTNAQFEQFAPEHKKIRGIAGASQSDDEPVTHVTWQQAADFCAWLTKREGKPYRLPTEAEWEYACRAGTKTPFSTGDKLTADKANFGLAAGGKKQTTTKVGSYPPNPWGLFDMAGNVAEWCADWYGPYENDSQIDPVGRRSGDFRVVRGWSYLPVSHPFGVTHFCRSANRSGLIPHDANRATGFRVALGDPSMTPPLPDAPRPIHQLNVKQTIAPNTGPNRDEPHFFDYRKADKMTPVSTDAWGPIFGAHNHFTAVCVCPNGDILAAWYSTVAESGRECGQAATRLRAGSDRWDPPSFFFGTPDCNTHAPVLLRDGQRIYHFCTQSLAGWDDAAEAMRFSDDSGATWSKPRIILTREDPRRMSQPCTAFVSKTGKLVLAVDGDFAHRDERIMLSADRGKTWTVAGGDMRKAVGKYAIHPSVVERADGSIFAFLRGPVPMPALVSADEGESWQPASTPFPGITSGQKAPALKLASGALLLCSFDNKKTVIGGGTFAALSLDDGKSWAHVRKVEGVGGYMSLAQAASGVIYLIGSRSTAVAFNEAWLKEGTPYPPAK